MRLGQHKYLEIITVDYWVQQWSIDRLWVNIYFIMPEIQHLKIEWEGEIEKEFKPIQTITDYTRCRFSEEE